MTLSSRGSAMFPIVVHHQASLSIWPVVQSFRRDVSTNPGVTMWCVCGCNLRDVCCICESYGADIVVMGVIWPRLCVNLILGRVLYLF